MSTFGRQPTLLDFGPDGFCANDPERTSGLKSVVCKRT